MVEQVGQWLFDFGVGDLASHDFEPFENGVAQAKAVSRAQGHMKTSDRRRSHDAPAQGHDDRVRINLYQPDVLVEARQLFA